MVRFVIVINDEPATNKSRHIAGAIDFAGVVTEHPMKVDAVGLRRDLRWHASGTRGDGVVIEDDIAGKFTRLGREAAQAAKAGQEIAMQIAAGHQLCRDRRLATTASKLDPRRLLSLQIPMVHGDRIAASFVGVTSIFFSITAVSFWCLIGVIVAACLVVHSDQVRQALLHSAASPAVWSFRIGVVLIVTKLLHELAHATVCRRLGGNVRSMGVMLFCGMPCPYCDVTDAWRLPQRHRRAAVMAAGVYAEWIIATVAGLVFLCVRHDGMREIAASAVVISFLGSVLFNANPLMRYDGYYVLADWLGSANLSRDSAAAFRSIISGPLEGQTSSSETMAAMPRQRRIGLATFHIVRSLYRSLMLVSIAGLIIVAGGWVGLQRLSLALVFAIALRTITQMVVRSFRFVVGSKTVNLASNKQTGGLNQTGGTDRARGRLRRGLLVLIGPALFVFAVTIPLPYWTTVTGFISPERVQTLQWPAEGVIREVHVRWGQQVKAGQAIAAADSETLESRQQTLVHQLATTKTRLDAAERSMASGDDSTASDRWQGLDQQSRSLAEQLISVRSQTRDMELHADLDGFVISPLPPSDSATNGSLPTQGNLQPNERQIGEVIRSSDHFARIASPDCRVVAHWPLANSTPVQVGDRVTVRLSSAEKNAVLAMTIEQILPSRSGANEHAEFSGATVRLVCVNDEIDRIAATRLPQWFDTIVDVDVIHPRRSIANHLWRSTRRYVMTEAWR